MKDDGKFRYIMAPNVTCDGTVSSPHEPRTLDLPEDVTVRCPECGQEYRRAEEWSPVWRARWPTNED